MSIDIRVCKSPCDLQVATIRQLLETVQSLLKAGDTEAAWWYYRVFTGAWVFSRTEIPCDQWETTGIAALIRETQTMLQAEKSQRNNEGKEARTVG